MSPRCVVSCLAEIESPEALAVLTLEGNPAPAGEESDAIAVQAVELPLPYPLLRAHVRE